MTLPDHFEFMCPTKTGSGSKALEHLPGDLTALNAGKPLIITDKKSTEKGLVKQITKAFRTSGMTLGVFDGVDLTADMETVRNLCSLYMDRGFDAIMALGQGRTVDLAKVVNIAVSGKPEDLKRCRDTGTLDHPLKPFVYIPLGPGTGRECSGDVAFGDLACSSPYLMPDLVTIDPRMLNDEDPVAYMTTGMASLTYAAEAYADPQSNPFCESYAQLVVSGVMENLLPVCRAACAAKGLVKRTIDGLSLKKDRLALVNALCMAGYVYANSPRGLAARLGLAVSDRCDADAAVAMGIMLPYVLEYHAHREGRDLSKIMRPMAGLDLYCSTPQGQRFDSAMGKIRHIQNEMFVLTDAEIPRTLEDAGLSRDAFGAVADQVAAQIPEQDVRNACLTILEHAFDGKPVTL
ncbi:iron-containing alcohol dehydrogenase [Desulfatiferula olefinivorans]